MFLRGLAWLVGLLAVIGVVVWSARERIAGWMEAALLRQCHERGIYLHYASRSWSPTSGLHLTGLVLHRDAAENHPVIELSDLSVGFPWAEIWQSRALSSHWRTKDGHLVLHDEAGAISFEHVNANGVLHGSQCDVAKLEFRHEAVAGAIHGRILLGPSIMKLSTASADSMDAPSKPSARNFTLNLAIVRTVLWWLDFKPTTGLFAVEGDFSVDSTGASVSWKTKLHGRGKNLEWFAVPLQEAVASAEMSGQGMSITSDFRLNKASAKVTASLKDWKQPPLLLTGRFSDPQGQSDTFSASYDQASRTLAIAALEGAVNPWEFAQNFPRWSPNVALPPGIRIRTFPKISLKDFRWSSGGSSATWSLGSVQLQSPADVTIAVGSQPMKIDRLKGQASYQDNSWRGKATTGRVTWGDWSVPKIKIDGEMASSKAKFNSQLDLTKGSIELSISGGAGKNPSWSFTGSLADSAGSEDRFTGSYDPSSQKTAVSQLSGKADLFELASNFKPVAAQLPAGLQIRSFPDIVVKDFTYKISKSADRWTIGALQLRSPADITLTWKGQPLPIDELKGSTAFDGNTWRLTGVSGQSLGGRFSVDGLYDGVLRQSTLSVTKLRLAELSSWKDDAQGSFADAVLSLDYRGTLGAEPAQLTGSGTLQMEDAPLVKVPLLDQTYTLFSAVIPRVKETGKGNLKATFKVTNGVFNVSQFKASGGVVQVTATGTLDLVQRNVSARAHGNLGGVAGLATFAVARTIQMEVSGPLDHVRVQPVGPLRTLGGGVSHAAKTTGDVLRTGVTMPFKVFDLFKDDPKN